MFGVYLDLAVMGNSGNAVLRRYRYIPDAEAVLRHGVYQEWAPNAKEASLVGEFSTLCTAYVCRA
jgi:1,4-alpha-glucan branching enzyme